MCITRPRARNSWHSATPQTSVDGLSYRPLRPLSLPCHLDVAKGNRVVGWNYYCKERYATARECFLVWNNNGRLRSGDEFEAMKSSRLAFKNALNYCKNNEQKIKKENMLRKFKLTNKGKFWKEVSKIKENTKTKLVQIDGVSDVNEIVNIFDQKYQGILDDPNCQGSSNVTTIPELPACNAPFFTMDD